MTVKLEEAEILRRQLAESQQRSQQLEQLLLQRGLGTFGEFVDGLRGICNGAQAGNPGALQNLKELNGLLELARGLASGVTPVRGIVVPPQNGKV